MNNNLELNILKLLLKKENHNKYYEYITQLTLSKELKTLINLINKYYSKYNEHIYIAPDELAQYYLSQFPNSKDNETYLQIINRLKVLEVSDSLASDIVRRLTAKEFAYKTIDFLIPLAEGQAEPELLWELPQKLDEYKTLLKSQDETSNPFLDYHPDVLFGFNATTDGLLWTIRQLNLTLGPLPKGTLGHVFARVETGKTTFISDQMTSWARQLRERGSDELILGVFNEENGKRIQARVYHSMLNMTPQECEAWRTSGKGEELRGSFLTEGGANLRLIHDTTMSLEKLTELLETYPVRALVVDIADHLHFVGDHKENEERRLNQIYRRLRELSDKYECDILSCGQAGDLASGRKRLLLEHMFHSKTAKPGALDYAIGIGASYDPAETDFRWLNICKNKLQASGHTQVQVRIDRERGRYIDL